MFAALSVLVWGMLLQTPVPSLVTSIRPSGDLDMERIETVYRYETMAPAP